MALTDDEDEIEGEIGHADSAGPGDEAGPDDGTELENEAETDARSVAGGNNAVRIGGALPFSQLAGVLALAVTGTGTLLW